MDTTDSREYAAKLRQGNGNSMVAAEYIDGLSLWVETLLNGIEEMKRYCTHCIDNSATSDLTSAKEEIARLFQCAVQTQRHADTLLDKLHAAESSLASERKETERLRGDIIELKAERDRWWAKAVGRVVELNHLYRILEQMDAMDIYQPITTQESEMRKLVSGALANRTAALQSRQGEE